MNATSLILYSLGIVLVIGGIIMLFFQTGLDAWVPSGIAIAGLIVIVGVAVMGIADKARPEEDQDEHRHE